MAQPHGFADLLEVVQETRVVVACDADVVLVNGVVDRFHVIENEVAAAAARRAASVHTEPAVSSAV